METTIKTIVREITPELAKQILQRNGSNRKLNQRLVEFYAIQMKNKQWRLTGQGISIDRDGCLQDGQHRLAAIVKYGKGVEMLMIYGTDPKNFSNYDCGKQRNVKDSLDIMGVTNSHDIGASIRNYLIRTNTSQKSCLFSPTSVGTSWAKAGYISVNDVLIEYGENSEFWHYVAAKADKYAKHLRILNKSHIGGMMGYLILKLEYDPKIVEGFFEQVFGILPDQYEITKHLRQILMRDKIAIKKIPPMQRGAYVHKTWNSYIKGGKSKGLSFNSEIEKFPELQ
ncbi:MAG: hypothetical protein M0P47_09330 [Bacteroidales bacterium]|nr:hypothetical protein [Bacteroidales bacterium]